MPDEFNMEFPREALKKAVKGTRREQLEAIRDYIANELEANLCSTCKNSRLRTGDQASLILRLQNVLAEIEALGDAKAVNRLATVRSLHSDGGPTAPASASADPIDQRRTGSRRPGGGRGPSA